MRSIFQGKILTLPNVLSFLRLCLIPCFVWTYLAKEDYTMTALILLLSGLTDTIDGRIARRFNMVSNLGKALDPLADKLTQIAMLFCLSYRFPNILIPLVALCAKEVFCASTSLILIRNTGEVKSADWHGKVTTTLLYATMILHLIWPGITPQLSSVMIALCTAMILLSGVLYGIRNIGAINAARRA